MAGRPFWSGQLKISLVSFGVQLFPATEPHSGVSFHQIDRATGTRIRHLNVTGDNNPVENDEIVKGYEYSKGKYITLEPNEIGDLRVPTKNVIEVQQFVDLHELQPALFEKPYFVVPEPKESRTAFSVVYEAMDKKSKAAIGEIAFGGREHLVAIAVPPDHSSMSMMAYTLRYGDEMRRIEDYLSGDAHTVTIDKNELALASQLIDSYSRPFDLDAFRDDYEVALRALIAAKQKNLPMPIDEEKSRPAKVINLMDALRQSVSRAKHPVGKVQPAKAKGPVIVGATRRKRRVA